ncbi:MAG: hypothetical protein M3R38_38795 [Actinomycetota bacterium]|nr:hypothetical protein [Actinomycetota bacterium]
MTAPHTVPDARALVEMVLARSPGGDSRIHGVRHWRRVAHNGLALLAETPEADGLLVFLFSLFHDAMRLNDHRDPDHGARAAALARELRGDLYRLDDARMDLLGFALAEHDRGLTSDDATVGACWDADRLNLWRVGIEPRPDRLSTREAKRPGRILWARRVMRTPPPCWGDLARGYGLPWPE